MVGISYIPYLKLICFVDLVYSIVIRYPYWLASVFRLGWHFNVLIVPLFHLELIVEQCVFAHFPYQLASVLHIGQHPLSILVGIRFP